MVVHFFYKSVPSTWLNVAVTWTGAYLDISSASVDVFRTSLTQSVLQSFAVLS